MIKRGGIHRWLAILGVSIATGTLLMGIVGAQEQLQVALGPANKTSYLLGEAVSIPGYADFGGADPSGASVSLVIDGPQATIMPLPIAPGLHLYPERNLEVAVTSISTTPSTLPSTLPFVGDSRLSYAIKWTPPTFLSPAPLYSLIPNTTQAFSIPLLPSPTPAGGGIANLPDTVTKFGIPLVGTPAPGQPAALPSATEAFPVPTPEVAAPEAGAPAELPALTEAFNIPAVPTPTPEVGAPANLPTLTEAFNIPLAPTPTAEPGAAAVLPTLSSVFSIPTAPTPAPVSGVAELPSRTVISTIPGDKNPQGLTYDGTSFYILVDGTAADEILKVNSSGVLDTTWGGGDGIVSVLLDGENRNQTADIAYLDSKLYVSDKGWYTDPVSFNGGYPVMVFNINGTYESYWFTPDWARFSGLHAEGTRLWGVRDDGDVIMKMSKTGASISTFWPWPNSNASAMAIGSGNYDYIYTVEGESIVKRSKTNGSSTGSSWEITDSLITGMTYSGGVLYFVDDDTNTLYKAQAPHGVEVTTNPLGLAYGGEELYILVDATPRDKVIVVNPADAANPPTIIRSFDAPSSTSDGLDYFDGFLWVGNGSTRQIKKLDPTAGNVIATLELTNPIWNDITGLGNNGTRLIGFTNNDRGFFTISKTDGAATRVEGTGDRWGYDAGTYRIDTSRAYGAKDNKVYEYNTSADLLQTITLATGTEVKGLTFIGPNLFIANGADNTIKKGSIPHGITTSTNPLALAYGTLSTVNTLFILTDGSPRDKIVRANPTTGDIIDSFNAPDDSGEGLTYLGTSLYYASNKDSNRRIYELNATTGAEIANFNPKNAWGWDMGEALLGLGNDGTDLILSTQNPNEACVDKIDKTNGDNKGRLCADWNTGLKEAQGVDVASDGFILVAKTNKIFQLTPEGKENAKWENLTLATAIKGITFVGNSLYIANDGATTDKIYKTTVPTGIVTTTDPLALAYGTVSTVDTLFILTDGSPRDKILRVNPTTGDIIDSFNAPDDSGQGLTYLGTDLYYASNKDNNRRIYKLNATTGAEVSNFNPKDQWGNNFGEKLRGLGTIGTDLILSAGNTWEPCFDKINAANGNNLGRLCERGDWNTMGIKQAEGVDVASDGFILAAKDNDLYQLTPEGNENAKWQNLAGVASLKGLTFVGNTLYLANDGATTDKIYKTTVPTGIVTTTDPLALAYGVVSTVNTLFILTDGSPRDKILRVNPTTGALIDSYDAPDDSGQGLAFLDTSLYYASNKDNNRKIYKLDPANGTELANFNPKESGGFNFGATFRALGTSGTNLLLSASYSWESCFDKINKTNGNNLGRLCADPNTGLSEAEGVDVAPDGTILAAKDNKIVRLTPDGKESARWQNLVGAVSIKGLTFVGNTLYVADDGPAVDKIFKATIPSGITKDPLGLAYGAVNTVNTLFILVDAAPVDHILLVNPTTGAFIDSYDAPNSRGGALTYLGTSLYYAGRSGQGRLEISKLNPADGNVLATIVPKYGWGGDINEDARSLSSNGNDLLLVYGNGNCIDKIDKTNGDNKGSLCGPQGTGLNGATGMEVASDGSIFLARDDEVVQLIASGGQNVTEVGSWNTTPDLDIEGLTFVGNILYLADDVNDKIYKASKPSGITNSPQDLAYDGTNLYILVDGANKDHVVVVNATSGAVVRDFDAPSRESQSLTYLNSFLYVGAAEEIPGQGLMRTITKISPVDGAVQAGNITIPMELNGRITGLSNNGSSLIGTQDQGMFAVFMNPTNGSFQKRVDFYDTPYMDGFSSLAFYDPSDDLFVTRGGKVLRVDDDGRGLSEFNTALTNLKGSVFVAEILYLAEATGNTIQAAAIPLPSTTVTTTPKGMATNGANLYLVVDGDPKDKILVLSTNPGTILNSYDAPGDNTNALAWHNGSLYAVTNEFHPNRGQQPPRVFKLNPANGAVVEEFDIKAPWGGTLGGMAGGLASDGSFLYVAMQNEQGSGWYRLNPATPNANSVRTDTSSPNITGFMTSFQSLEVAEAIPGEPRLLAGGYATREGPGQIPVVTRFNKATGEMLDLWEMGNAEITGMAYIGTVLYLADATSDAILSTSLPENIPEITAVGSYQATLRVLHASVTVNSSPTVNFSLVRNTNPRVRITSPAPNFSTVNDVIGVQGRVSDPSIKQVLVGVDLPFTSLLQDSVTPQQSAGKWNVQGQWYVSCNEWQQDRPFPKNASSPCSWRYGLQGQFPFAPSITTQGTLTTRDPILIGTGANLSFGTWYDTEPVPDRDLKRVEVAEVTKDEDGNDVVGEFKAIIQIVGRGFGQSAPPANAHSTFSYREIEQARIDFDPQTGLPVPSFTGVGKSLSAFNGKRILIRFNFDSVNNFANDGFGWFLDDIVVSGAGFKGELVNVTPLNPPIVEGTTTWFSQFTKPLGLADGLNTIRAVGELPYPPKPNGPNLKGQAQVSGFLDRAAPQVSLSGITPITATTIQTLMGTVDDMNFDSMEITQTNVFGTQTIYAINALPGNRSFSVPVSLLEGENIFEATAIDQSDLTSTVSLTAYLDTAGPTLTPLNTRYPVGAFSARAGDEAILQVNASDARGVQRVYITNPNGTLEDMVRSSEIPEAVLHQWGVTGGWLLPIEIPSGAPPGAYQLTVTALDNAQNTTVRTLQADVVATLRGFTFSLMPGSNLISMPLIPDTSSIVELLNAEVLAAIDTIMYYDASLTALPQEDRWLMFSPSAPPGVNTLTQLNTGLGYFFKMKSTAFSYSAPLAPGLPPTPRPIQFSYTGVFLKEATVPPTYPVVPGWVMMGFHSELVLPVTTALRSLEVPYPVWASLYQYDNLIRFSLEEDPEIILGGFRRVLSTGYLEPGRGYWIYVVQSGTIVP